MILLLDNLLFISKKIKKKNILINLLKEVKIFLNKLILKKILKIIF